MTALELAQQTAREHGIDLTDDEAEHVLWEHTGFPGFWLGSDTAEDALRHQLHKYFGTQT